MESPSEVLDFVIIGAQKSASSFLRRRLDQHPAVDLAKGEVPSFEDPYYDRGAVDRLSELFGPRRPDVRRGIKRPDYLGQSAVPARLAAHVPSTKLFAVLRDPVARAVSAYFHYVRHNFIPVRPCEEGLTALLDNRLQTQYPRSAEILTYGRYGEHLGRYLDHFPREQMIIFQQERLAAEPAEVVRESYEFIGVDSSFVPGHDIQSSNSGVYDLRRLRFLRTGYRAAFVYEKDLRTRRPRRSNPMGSGWLAAVRVIDKLALSHLDRSRAPTLSEPLRARLRDYYAADTARLRALLGQNFPASNWLRCDQTRTE